MQSDAALIEEIVGRVLRELGTTGEAPRRRPPVATEIVSPEARIATQVVTREVLEGLTGAARAVRVASKAILTPSARDYVRQHGLTVIRETSSTTNAMRLHWQVIVSTSTPTVTSALDALRSAGVEFEPCLVGEPREAAAHGVNALCRAEAAGVVVLSDRPELVACLANRNERVRAAGLSSIPGLERLRSSLQPNLLVVDPLDKSQFELRQLLKTIVTWGANVAQKS